MALSDEEIFPAVVIVVEEAYPPSRVSHGHLANASRVAGIAEGAVSVVLVERVALIRQVGDDNVRPSIVIVIGKIHAHASVGSAIQVDRDFGGQTDLFEGSVALIVIKELNHGVIGHKKVDCAVTVIVGDRKT